MADMLPAVMAAEADAPETINIDTGSLNAIVKFLHIPTLSELISQHSPDASEKAPITVEAETATHHNIPKPTSPSSNEAGKGSSEFGADPKAKPLGNSWTFHESRMVWLNFRGETVQQEADRIGRACLLKQGV